MGCDIHVYVEYKKKKAEKAEKAQEPAKQAPKLKKKSELESSLIDAIEQHGE